MKFAILTLFPEMLEPFLHGSILGRAIEQGVIEIELCNLRDWATDKHKSVDDTPYGGGPGMVLRVDVIDRALAELKSKVKGQRSKVILLTPQGQQFTQATAEQLVTDDRDLILIAGHYEGFDERVRSIVDRELSIGDYVLTGGELPAAVVVDAVARLLPGVLNPESLKDESFSTKSSITLEYPHYTRPDSYTPISQQLGELTVPDILKSGDHQKIAAWRLNEARKRTHKPL
ncbi:tRNA (guanosine(37)-N1)-methyltransferase TrmD [Candidatus Berkelbacteria bacterium]|nr:tRNA (guanosine(37)-N1)-methyltransferase TrmD [Candidatus Berkelbacteria bacterium]